MEQIKPWYLKPLKVLNPLEKKKLRGIAIIFGIVCFAIVYFLFNGNNTRENETNNPACTGNQSCITEVRERFRNTGKTILGEEYLSDGVFGVSFMDAEHVGTFNATVLTDCNCNIKNVDVSTVH